MKILLLALPRTGSKFVHRNIDRYLAVDNPTVKLTNDSQTGEWYEPLYQRIKFLGDNGNVITEEDKTIIKSETSLNNAIDIIPKLSKDLVIKYHHVKGIRDIEKQFISLFDKVYLLHRRKYFESALSFALSDYFDSWIPNVSQRDKIAKSLVKKIDLDEESWINIIQSFKELRNLEIPGVSKIFFEDMIQLKSSKEFCEHLGLPFKDFNIVTDQEIEFGKNKYSMITNLDRLVELFKEEMAK